MQYYSISPAAGTKETGQAFPQLDEMKPGYNFDAPDSVHKIEAFKIPDFTPDLDYFILNPKANMTDVLSQAAISAYGLMVSEKFKNLLSEFNIQEHRFYKANIKTKNGFVTYYWLQLGETNILNEIDYSKSQFFISEFGFEKEDILIDSYINYEQKNLAIDDMSTIQRRSIKLTEKKSVTDAFVIPFLDGNIYFSENLYNTINEQGLTGIEVSAVKL